MTTYMRGDKRKGDLAKLARGYSNTLGIKDPQTRFVMETMSQTIEWLKRKAGQIVDVRDLYDRFGLDYGQAQLSSDLTLHPDEKKPTPPSICLTSAEWNGDLTADVEGWLNANGKTTTYYFRYGQDMTMATSTGSSSGGSSIANIQIGTTLTGLELGKTYYVQAIAENEDGEKYSNILSFETGEKPTVVTTIATAIKDVSAKIHGTINPNGLASTYHFEWGNNMAMTNSTADVDSGLGIVAIDAEASITGLVENTIYYYRLVGTNACGTTYGSRKQFRTKANDAPDVEILPDTFRTDVSTQLNGTVNPNGFETVYHFEYGLNNTYVGPNTSIPAIPLSVGNGEAVVVVAQAITGLIPDSVYHARLVATNSYGTTYSGDLAIPIPIAELSMTGSLDFGTIYNSDTGTVDLEIEIGNVSLGTSTARWSLALTGDASLIGNLSAIPPSGETANGQTSTITIQLDRAGFVVGTYSATITATDQYAPDPVTLPISLTVIPSVPNSCPYDTNPPQPNPLTATWLGGTLYYHLSSPRTMPSVTSCNWNISTGTGGGRLQVILATANPNVTTYEPWAVGQSSVLASVQAGLTYPCWFMVAYLSRTAFDSPYDAVAIWTKTTGGDPNGVYTSVWSHPTFSPEHRNPITVSGA